MRAAIVAMASLAVPLRAQEYRSSVVGTDFDMIVEDDPSTFLCLESHGRGLREMPDKTRASELIQEAFIFVSYFEDGTSVDMALDVDFGSEEAARTEALRYVHRLGKLPTSLRRGVDRMVIHKGEPDATAFSDVGLIVVYSDNATKRISTHDLEETVFHESVHAAWDKQHARSEEWREAQALDGTFVTEYAGKKPDGEDLAESALLAYTLLHHPERIPPTERAAIAKAIPARIAFVEKLLPPGEPIYEQVGPPYGCDGSGTTFVVAEERRAAPANESNECTVNRHTARGISDIVSNALLRGLGEDESRVRPFLTEAKNRYATADELVAATADEFGIDRAALDAKIVEYFHCNCDHGPLGDAEPAPASVTTEPAETSEIRTLLYAISALLLLLLVVNASTLGVLVKQARRSSRE